MKKTSSGILLASAAVAFLAWGSGAAAQSARGRDGVVRRPSAAMQTQRAPAPIRPAGTVSRPALRHGPVPLAAAAAWRSVGPDGGDIYSIDINPVDPNVLTATAMGVWSRAIYRSRDAGATWSRLAQLGAPDSTWPIAAFVAAPSDADVMYASLGFRVIHSEDGGASWTGTDMATGCEIQSLCPHPSDAAVVYGLGIYDKDEALNGFEFYKSTDGGATWSRSHIIGGVSTYPGELLLSPSDPATLYFAANVQGTLRLFRSRDGGATWTTAVPVLPGGALAVDPLQSQVLYAAGSGGVSKSSDGGDSWTAPFGNFTPHLLVVDRVNPAVLYVSAFQGLFKTTDGGATWVKLEGTDWDRALAAAGGRVYRGGLYGLQRSLDGGQNWQESQQGIREMSVGAIRISPASPNVFYAWAGSVYRSSDYGASWTRRTRPGAASSAAMIRPLKTTAVPRPTAMRRPGRTGTLSPAHGPSYPVRMAVHPLDPDKIYVVDSGLFFSGDGGATWSKRSPRPNGIVLDLALSRNNPAHLFAVGEIDRDTDLEVYVSTDEGLSWTIHTLAGTGSPYRENGAIGIDASGSVIYAGSQVEGPLYKSTDGGVSWRRLSSSVLYDPYSIAVDPDHPDSIVVGTWSGVYRSADGGGTWSRSFPEIPVPEVRADPSNFSRLIAASHAGMLASLDGGVSWSPGNEGLTAGAQATARCVDWVPSARITLMGTWEGAWRTVESNTRVLSIGVGGSGTTSPSPGDHYFRLNAVASVTAIPSDGYAFVGWTGDAEGTANPLEITMSDNRSVVANFQRALFAPVDFAAVKDIARSLLQGRYFDRLTWKANPATIGAVRYRVYEVTGGTRSPLAEMPATVTEYRRWDVSKDSRAVYEVTTIDTAGFESPAAQAQVK